MRGVIAVIDDNELTRVLAGDALCELEYEPVLFPSCAEAFEALQRQTPAACLVDHCMPGMTGAEFVSALRASPDARLRDLPIIAFTTRFEREMLEAGADASLRKPFKLPALEAVLSHVVRPPEAPAPAAPIVELLEPFSALHAGARERSLDPGRLSAYRELRAELTRVLASAQEAARGGASRRGALRVRAALPVIVVAKAGSWRGITADLSASGFSTVLGAELAPGDEVEFSLLAPRRAIRGRGRVANVTPAGSGLCRVGLAFLDLSGEDRDEAEALVLDRVLGAPDGSQEPPPGTR